jgi:cytochrome P450
MSKWLKTINRINSNRFQIPAGWQTREQVAVELQCDPDRVADLLKPGLQSGDFERKDFPVWDSARRMTVRVVCYRVCGEEKQSSKSKPALASDLDEKIRQAIERNPLKDDRLISKNTSAPIADVRRVRAELSA